MDHRQHVMQQALVYRTRIQAYLLGLTRRPAIAEDLFQDTFLVICERWEQFQPGTDFLAWALTIARFKYLASIDPKRHRERRMAEVFADACAAKPIEEASENERLAQLDRCVGKLPARARVLIDLRYRDGLDVPAVARQVGMSINALSTMMSRVRKQLRECIERHGVVSGDLS
jgi:RNA polymerase sigma-70 factor (ECF subfamily)